MARNAAGIAPANIILLLLSDIPPKINSPRPPAPTNEAKVATPTLITVAVRIPAIMTGIAKGNCTLNSNCHGFIPIAFPASITLTLTPVMPVYVFRIIGNSA
ncbi:hypothetical protein D3C86_1780040 [compost metagenome]